MPTTAQEVFINNVRLLPPAERLRLAALILADLTQTKPPVIDYSDTWGEQDRNDLTAFSL